jgi:hypothetical protein
MSAMPCSVDILEKALAVADKSAMSWMMDGEHGGARNKSSPASKRTTV